MIKLKNIIKTYETPSGPVTALKGITLDIAKGEIFGIIGLSGAGKSTLVRCINLLEAPTSGSVVVDGKELTTMSSSELRQMRKHIGMIFQHFNLLSNITVFDNVAFPMRLDNKPAGEIAAKVEELLKLVGLWDKKDMYPAELSGGQKQRVGIARALALDPKVLLCDEATSALDPQTTKSILDLILDINQKLGLTVVVITHEMQVIKEICDKVAVISNGVIAELGTVLDVFTHPKEPITKEFISILYPNDIPAELTPNGVKAEYFEGSVMLLRVLFIGREAKLPIINALIKHYKLDVGILSGQIDQIKTTTFGRLIIGVDGDKAEIERGIEHLKSTDLEVEVIGYVPKT